MAATGNSGAIKKCPMCDEEITDPTLHYRKCKGADGPVGKAEDESSKPSLSTETAKVCFTWTSTSGYPYQDVTLLSAFQSIELYLAQQSATCQYVSDEVSIPVGEFDGQLVIGGSYCYPVKKFLIEEDGDIVQLELDITKIDTVYDNDTEPANTGTYNQYVSAYNTGSTSSDTNPVVHLNPAYNDHYDSYEGGGERKSTGGGPTKLLMIFTPTAPGEDTTAFQPGDVMYAMKNKTDQPQLMPHTHNYSCGHTHDRNDSQSPPSSADRLGETFSQQLSEEGFTPAIVKSKKGNSTSSSSTMRYSPDPSTHTTSSSTRNPKSRTTTPDRLSNSTTSNEKTTTGSSKTNERFSVSQIKGSTSSNTSGSVTMEEHVSVCNELDRLKKNHERVTAQLEGKLRKLQKKLSKYEVGKQDEDEEQPLDNEDKLYHELEEIREENDEIRNDLESKEKELAEAKDRMTALENQIEEYAGTIDDQSRVIHNYTHHGGGDRQYAKLLEMFNNMSEFTKKQQCEFKMIVTDTQKKIEGFAHIEKDNQVLRKACDQLSSEVTTHRSQTKQLLKDIENKEMEAQALKQELRKEIEGRHGRQTSEMESLELETLRQKCVGWKESAESAMDDVEVLRIHVQQLEQEIESLNRQLREKAQAENNVGAGKVSELQKKLKEFQDIRINMEEEMSKLRIEKTDLVSRNAELVSSCDPEEIKKVKQELEEEKELLAKELKETQALLEVHQQKNLDLKDQLEKTLNSAKLDLIQEKMARYKRERDALRLKVASIEEEHGIESHKLQMEIDTLKQKKRRYRESCKLLEANNKDLVQLLRDKDDTIASIQQYNSSYGNSQELIDHVKLSENIDGSHVGHTHDSTHDSTHDIPSLPRASRIGSFSSTQSLPVEQKQKPKSGIVLTSSVKTNPTHRSSVTSLVETTPRRLSANEYIPSLSADEEVKAIQVRTMKGLQEAYVQRLDQDALTENMNVVVLRSKGHYEEGVVKYFGYLPNCSDLMIGVQLELPRADSSNPNDGTFKDGQQYFKCNKGHGLYVALSKLFLKLDVS